MSGDVGFDPLVGESATDGLFAGDHSGLPQGHVLKHTLNRGGGVRPAQARIQDLWTTSAPVDIDGRWPMICCGGG